MTSDGKNAFDNPVAYNGYIGRWSRLIAAVFVDWLGVPREGTWLDVGAGTGVLTHMILQRAAPQKVVGTDLSQSYIDLARQDVVDSRVEFHVLDVNDLASTAESTFDAAVAGLVLNFVPAPLQTVQSMHRLVKRGGAVAAYVWDYAGRMEIMRQFWDAAISIDPTAAAMDSGQQFPLCKPDALRALFEAAALTQIEVIPLDIQADFKDFDDYWLPFLGAQGSVSKYLRSLDDDGKQALTVQLRKQLPIMPDGSIRLTARAWAVKGIR